MSAYYIIANLTRLEYVDPHLYGSSIKRPGFLQDELTSEILSLLLTDAETWAFHRFHPIENGILMGRWKGDSIVFACDESEDEAPIYDAFLGGKGQDITRLCVECLAIPQGPMHPLSELIEHRRREGLLAWEHSPTGLG